MNNRRRFGAAIIGVALTGVFFIYYFVDRVSYNDASLGKVIGIFAVITYGLHLILAYLLKYTMYFGAVPISPNDYVLLRVWGLLLGIAMYVIGIYHLF